MQLSLRILSTRKSNGNGNKQKHINAVHTIGVCYEPAWSFCRSACIYDLLQHLMLRHQGSRND